MANGSAKKPVDIRWQLRLVWSSTHDIPNNRSNVKVELWWEGLDQYSAVNSSVKKTGNIKINGTQRNFSGSGLAKLSARQSKKIYETSMWVGHNADGNKTINISGTFNMDVRLRDTQYDSATVSTNANLGQIPRKSTITSIQGNQIGGEITVNISRKHDSFKHDVYYKRPDGNNVKVGDKVDTVCKFTPSANDASLMPNDTSKGCQIIVDTFAGGTKTGVDTKNFTLTVPNTAAFQPTISAPNVSIANNGRDKEINKYVQGISKAAVSFSSNAQGGATVKTRTINVKKKSNNANSMNINGASGTTGTLTQNGVYLVTATITDSRNRSKTSTKEFTVEAYSAPKINDFRATRLTGTTNVAVLHSGTWSNLGGSNKLTIKIERQPYGGNWSDVENRTETSGGFGKTTNSTGNSETTSYDFRITIRDTFGKEAAAVDSVSTAKTALSIKRDVGIGAGKVWERGALDVGGNAFIEGNLEITGRDKDIRFVIDPKDGNAGLELGSTETSSTPYLDFHSSGQPHDFDARIITSGGSETERGKGELEFIAGGGIKYNGVESGQKLWEGVVHMYESDAIKPSVNIKDCPGGWGLLFSRYDLGSRTAKNDNWYIFYISKRWWTNGGVKIPMLTSDGILVNKYIYANADGDGRLKGHSQNKSADNVKICLREVFAW